MRETIGSLSQIASVFCSGCGRRLIRPIDQFGDPSHVVCMECWIEGPSQDFDPDAIWVEEAAPLSCANDPVSETSCPKCSFPIYIEIGEWDVVSRKVTGYEAVCDHGCHEEGQRGAFARDWARADAEIEAFVKRLRVLHRIKAKTLIPGLILPDSVRKLVMR